MRENRARENAQVTTNKQMKSIQEALAHFMDTYDPARRAPVSIAVKSCTPTMDTPIRTSAQPRAPTMSTPITPPGAPQNFRSEFSLSPVNQATPAETMRVDRGRDLNERHTHVSGIGGDTQLTMNTSSGLNNIATHNASSPKVPIFDGTVSAHFRPWVIHSLRPLRATNAGRPERRWYAWCISNRPGSEHANCNDHGPTG